MANLFSAGCGNRIKGNGHKLEHRKFWTNMRRIFFTARVTEHWNGMPREVVDSPSPEIFKTLLDTCLYSLLQEACFVGGLGSMNSGGSFQPLQFCDSVIMLFHLSYSLLCWSSPIKQTQHKEKALLPAVYILLQQPSQHNFTLFCKDLWHFVLLHFCLFVCWLLLLLFFF